MQPNCNAPQHHSVLKTSSTKHNTVINLCFHFNNSFASSKLLVNTAIAMFIEHNNSYKGVSGADGNRNDMETCPSPIKYLTYFLINWDMVLM